MYIYINDYMKVSIDGGTPNPLVNAYFLYINIFYFGRLYSPFSDIQMLIPSGDAFHGGYEPFKVR